MIPQEVKDKIEGHTKGPWRIIGNIKGNDLYCMVLAKDETSSTPRELEVFSLRDSHVDKGHLKRRFADMNLIAKAPEMLDEIQALNQRVRELEEENKILKIDAELSYNNGFYDGRKEGEKYPF